MNLPVLLVAVAISAIDGSRGVKQPTRIRVVRPKRILLLIKVMQICNHWPTDHPGLHIEPLHLHASTLSIHGSILVLQSSWLFHPYENPDHINFFITFKKNYSLCIMSMWHEMMPMLVNLTYVKKLIVCLILDTRKLVKQPSNATIPLNNMTTVPVPTGMFYTYGFLNRHKRRSISKRHWEMLR
jgi:hypothetical protein